MYVGASLWVNSEMGTSLYQPINGQSRCEWSLYLDVCRSLPLDEL